MLDKRPQLKSVRDIGTACPRQRSRPSLYGQKIPERSIYRGREQDNSTTGPLGDTGFKASSGINQIETH